MSDDRDCPRSNVGSSYRVVWKFRRVACVESFNSTKLGARQSL